ncbi:MAG: putative nucleic-acid-binding protein [Phenylobacterium sp.]|jgi:predicted nucleic-acid-binding protein
MIGLDTNVLVRFIMRDDEAQYQKSYNLISSLDGLQNQGYINLVVLTELAFLLLRTYKIPKDAFITVFFSLTQKSYFFVEQGVAVSKSLIAFKTLNADFHDILITYLNDEAGIETTFTFDKKAANRVSGFKLL